MPAPSSNTTIDQIGKPLSSLPQQLCAALILILFIIAWRTLPHEWNFTPVGALALLGGSILADRRLALAVPLIGMLASALYLHGNIYADYSLLDPAVFIATITASACYLLYPLLGRWVQSRSQQPLAIGISCLAGAVAFFAITNFVHFLTNTGHSAAELVQCYIDAIPFFRRSLAADVLFSAVLYSAWAVITSLAGETSPLSTQDQNQV